MLAADAAALAPPPHALVAPATATWSTVVVARGDTLWHLAVRHHTTTAALVAKNRLPGGGHLLRVGQKLLVPASAAGHLASGPTKTTKTTKTSTTSTRTPARTSGTSRPTTSGAMTASGVHVVRSGDTMTGIAKRYRVSLSALLAANPRLDARMIFVGQKVVVPSLVKTAPTTSSTSGSGHTYPSTTTTRAATSKARLAASGVPTRTETAAMIRATALRHGVDPRLALAIGWQESGWNQRAVSSVNALGVMQVMPISGIWANQLAGRTLDLYDAQDNITAGVLILRSLQHSATSRDQAIAAYYQGLYSVRTRGLYQDTRAYVASILRIYARM